MALHAVMFDGLALGHGAPPLRTDEAHVWYAGAEWPADDRLLAADERARAARFATDRDRRRWIAARVLLRRVVSAYLGIGAEHVDFTYTALGKPVLAGDTDLHFNLSHSAEMAACAVSCGRDVGVDIEAVRPIHDMDGVFRAVGTASEVAVWRALPVEGRREAFFRCWTIKESCAKGLGAGFRLDMRTVDVLRHTGTPTLVACGGREWDVRTFAPARGYAGALAVSRGGPPGA